MSAVAGAATEARPIGLLGGVRNFALYLAACLFVGFGLFPLYMMITTSLKTDQQAFAWPPVWLFEPTFHSYYNALFVFGGRSVDTYVINSLLVTLVSSALAVFLGAMAAYGLARFRFRGNRDIAFFILSTRFAPPVGFIVPIYLMVQRSGLLDNQLALIIVYTSMNLSFVTWIMRGFFIEIPIEIEEAALVDGASRWYAFRTILLPLSRTGILAVMIIVFAFDWAEFLFAFILTATPQAMTFPVGVQGLVTQFEIIWNDMAAAGAIAMLLPLVLMVLARRHVVTGLTFGVVREK